MKIQRASRLVIVYLNTVFRCFVLLGTVVLMSCGGPPPVDAVYYGDWVSERHEEYNYALDSTIIIAGDDEWMTQRNILPISIHFENNQLFYQTLRSKSGKKINVTSGKWSMRSNTLTIQTDDFLISGQMVLLNDQLYISGHQYPLTPFRQTIQEKGIRISHKYRRALRSEKFKVH